MAKPKKLRIAYLFDDSLDRPDGVQQYVRVLGEWMHRRGHLVHYLVGETTQPGEISPRVFSLSTNISVRGNQNQLSLPLPASPRLIKQTLQDGVYDVVHVQMPYNPLMAGRVITRLPHATKLVGTFHIVGVSMVERFGTKILGWLQKVTLLRVDTALSVSIAAHDFAARYYGLGTDVVPNVVDVTQFATAKPKKHLRPTKHTILFLGRLVERKGADHLLKAINHLRETRNIDDVTVHICSDGPMRQELEEYVKEHELTQHVIFHGYIEEDEKADYLASADVSVFPSTGGESFGIVLVEAMASGNAVVLAGDNAGYRTVMEYDDYLFEPSDHRALAEKIWQMLNDTRASRSAKKWQKQRARDFDVEKVGKEIEQIYFNA